MKIFYPLLSAFLSIFTCTILSAQTFTNTGKEFWVAYGHHQFMEAPYNNDQEMVIYLATGDSGAIVTIQIDSSGNSAPPPTGGPWSRTYTMPANTVISIEDPMPAGVIVTKSPSSIPAISPIPKGLSPRDAGFDARLYSCAPPVCSGGEGLFRKKGIHITSTAPIVAYAHIYGQVSSGATMLIPVETWGYNYTSVNSEQFNADNAYSWMYVMANHDSTWIQITPSVATRNGKPAGVPFDTVLNRGQVYQLVGKLYTGSTTAGYNLTGTTVTSIEHGTDKRYPIAVFSGSSRTGGETPCNTGGRDNDIQQNFPEEAWGKTYLTAPFSNSGIPSSLMQCVYKVAVTDTSAIVKRNGVILTGLIGGKYYKFASATADYIESDKPVMVAQFMGGGCVTGDGDPEMIYLSPLEQSLNKARFYRNTKEFVNVQYLTLVIPTGGVASLKIDGVFFASIPAAVKHSYPHPNLPGYTVIIRQWPAAKGQCIVESLTPFTGITYGLGGAESYGYNIGAHFDYINTDIDRFNNISGYLFLDKNSDGIKDSSEPYFNDANIVIVKSGIDTFGTMTSTGMFNIYADTGSFTTTVVPYKPYYTVAPASHTSFFGAFYQKDSIAFAVQSPSGVISDVAINIIPLSNARVGNIVKYNLVYQNLGTDTASGIVELVKDSRLIYASALPAPTSVNGDTLRWNFSNFYPSLTEEIGINFGLASIANSGDTLISSATISTIATDMAPADNITSITQRVVASYDPNDKAENHGGFIKSSAVAAGEYMQYTIRFQNTGTDTALNINIKDTLDSRLDVTSLRMITASHNYQMTITGDKNCVWSFDNINLVDSNHNEPQSHGYLTYVIKPKATVAVGDTIKNRAAIYFDSNPAVFTNVESTVVYDEALPLKLTGFEASRNGKTNLLTWTALQEINVSHFEVERSTNAQDFVHLGNVTAGGRNYSFADEKPVRGINYYRLKILDRDGKFFYSPVRTVNNSSNFYVSLYPNPAKDKLQLHVASDKKTLVQLHIVTADGRIVISQQMTLSEGDAIKSINITGLQKGHYFLKMISAEKETVTINFTKQ